LIERFKEGRHYFVAPGGGIEPGETPAQAAIREAREETGWEPRLGPEVAVLKGGTAGEVVEHYFLGETESRDFGSMTGPEVVSGDNRYEPRWVDAETLTKINLFPADLKPVIANVLRNVVRARDEP
jgi:8-oxo-dGTP diphosphatase